MGTSFNINDYSDDTVTKTTLVDGAVRVGKLLLHPGEQARDDRNGQVSLVRDADVEAAVAWKNGHFQFKSASIESVMRQLSRWYDIRVTYQGAMPQGHITGKLSRNMY